MAGNHNIKRLYENIELIASAGIILGLIFMQSDNPGLYTQIGIYLWAAAQFILIIWWDKRLSNAAACIWMGAFNLGGAAVFFWGNVTTANFLGIFISCCYIGSSFLQLAGGAVRIPAYSQKRIHMMLAILLARKILIAASAVQALGGMCFIILTPLAGICFTIAAFMGLMMNILHLQAELLESAPAEAYSPKNPKPASAA